MRAAALSLLFTTAVAASEAARVPPWELHSSFWMSLHQTLLEDAARSKPRDLEGFDEPERSSWTAAVTAYRDAGPDPFGKPMWITTDAISQIEDDAPEPPADAPMADALRRAAPAYRRHLWSDDDRANRFVIGYAAALLREGGAELVRAHEKVYRAAWPKRIRAYLCPYGGRFGAYTLSGEAGGVITTMSSRDAGYQGLRVLEMLLHESSHAIVGPRSGKIAEAIAAAGKKRGIEPPRDLWHAILFSTSSELTRRFLVERGTTGFVPSSEDMFARVWPAYRAAVERHWVAYLDGKGTLEEAIDKIVEEIPR